MALDLYEELSALTKALDAGGLPYAVCGGLAVAIHGAPRFTKDLDLLVLPGDVERVKATAKALGFVAESLPMRLKPTGEMHRVIKFAPSGEVLALDLLLVDAELEPVWNTRVQLSADGRSLWVVSRKALLSMKLASGRPQDLLDAQKLAETE
ncbi:MAG: hypothetical protein HY901_04895 [Deltaproteobacteria bacterium]|nr:hypothetical protein [Deltaproteobacteria bacterium]